VAQSIEDSIKRFTDPKLRKAAMDRVLSMGGEAVEPLLAVLEKTDDQNLRQTIIRMLPRLKDIRAVAPLRKLTYDADMDIRANAAAALSELDAAGSVEDMKRVAADRIEPSKRSILLRTLGKMGYQADVLKIVQKMIAEEYPHLEVAVLDMAQYADRSMYDVFMSLLSHPSHFVVSSAMAGLTKIPDDRVIERFIALLTDPRPIIRVSAATKLGTIGDPRAIEPIKALLKDKEPSGTGDYREGAAPTVADMAAMALKQFRSQKPWWKIW
jgi:HEAT repeat protein